MNSSSQFRLEVVDRVYAKFVKFSSARVIIAQLNEKFWSVMFFAIATSCFYVAFSLSPSANGIEHSATILILAPSVFGLAFTASAHVLGATNHLLDRRIIQLSIKVFICSCISAVAVTLVVNFLVYQPIGRYIILIATALNLVLILLIRSVTWFFNASYMPVVSLIGDKKFCEEASEFLNKEALPLKINTLSLREGGEIPGFVADFDITNYPVSVNRLHQWITDTKTDHIVYQPDHWNVLERPLVEALATGKAIAPFAQYVEEHYQVMPTWEIPNSALFSKSFANSSPSYLLSKRVCDVVLALIGFLCSLPILMVAGVLIKLEDRGPVFYKQTRVGRYGEHFTIYKLRSMRLDSETKGAEWASKGDSRITRIGKFLRRSRVDELPQFLNILKGDMSFIGPRPERPEFTSLLDEELRHYNLRHLLKPGLTGWAQINYPYGDSVEDAKQKLSYDLYYVKYATLSLDLQITLRTIGAAMQGAR